MKETLEAQQKEIIGLNQEVVRLKEIVIEVKDEIKSVKLELISVKTEIVDLKLEAKDIKNIIEVQTEKLKSGVEDVEDKMSVFSKYGYAINIFLILAVLGAVVALVMKQ